MRSGRGFRERSREPAGGGPDELVLTGGGVGLGQGGRDARKGEGGGHHWCSAAASASAGEHSLRTSLNLQNFELNSLKKRNENVIKMVFGVALRN